VNFFNTFDNTQTHTTGNKLALYTWNPGVCLGNGEIYTYRTLDTRVENISPTPEQISSSYFYKFKNGSDLEDFHNKTSNSLAGILSNIEDKIQELNGS